ncbi:MAG: polyphosphate kinase 2 family protein [bacterium]|nr:polyphosphate kinase 2 family protein [bacterium]
MDLKLFLVSPGQKVKLKNYDPDFTGGLKKGEARKQFEKDSKRLGEFQDMMFAQNPRTYGALGVFQAPDGAGKDSVAQAVMSQVRHSGCRFTSFGVPTDHELDHAYQWRHALAEPRRGCFDIWIRSHLEEVLAARVHPEVLARQHLPEKLKDKDIWKRRYAELRNYHWYLFSNGFTVTIIFLHISWEEQWKQLYERIADPTKHWKSSIKDVQERQKHWRIYHKAVETMLSEISTENTHAYVVPADHRWFAKMLVARIFVQELEKLNLRYPKLTGERKKEIEETKRLLLAE